MLCVHVIVGILKLEQTMRHLRLGTEFVIKGIKATDDADDDDNMDKQNNITSTAKTQVLLYVLEWRLLM